VFKAVILGAPGSGKGTISERIVRDFGLAHLASGDLLRSHVSKQTALGKEAKKYIENGQLVPDVLMVDLISEELKKLQGRNWLLDGFPRTASQAKTLHGREPVDVVISLDVPAEVIVDRIKGRLSHPASGRIYHTEFNPPKKPGVDDVTGEPLVQRADDNPETVRKRLDTYAATMAPLVEFYKSVGILETFPGRETNQIWPKVYDFLSTKIKPTGSKV
jgi:nucleoside-triphosphate--adenylate kinase